MKKVFVILLLGALIFQCTTSLVIKQDITETIKESLLKIKQQVAEAASKIKTEVFEAKKELDGEALDLFDGALAKMNVIYYFLERGINSYVQKATDKGVDVHECTDGLKEFLDKSRHKLEDEIYDCVQEKIDYVEEEAEKVISKLVDRKMDLEEKFNACNDKTCLVDVEKDAEILLTSLPTEVKRSVLEVKSLITTAKNKAGKCGHQTLMSIINESGRYMETVIGCIQNKIGEK